MNERKPKPSTKSKLQLREPAKPLAEPETRKLPDDHPVMEIFRQAAQDSPPLPTTPHHSPPLPSPAPARDFNRRANSLDREALPGGLFPGSSKKIYDALYLRSRGAHPPRTSVRASRRDFLDWTDIRNLKTVDGHLRYLISIGLIVRRWQLGSTEGSEYEVRLPEELPPLPTTPHHSPPVTTTHFLGSGYTQFLGSGGDSQPVDLQRTYGDDKTIEDKRINTDDEPLARALREAERELTGKVSGPDAWNELAELLATELRIAAGRTTVSSVPAFFTEHLRRRLWKKDKRQIEAEPAAPRHPEGPKPDASQCPDCFGTGMYYPEGYERGVARCAHEKLAPGGTQG